MSTSHGIWNFFRRISTAACMVGKSELEPMITPTSGGGRGGGGDASVDVVGGVKTSGIRSSARSC